MVRIEGVIGTGSSWGDDERKEVEWLFENETITSSLSPHALYNLDDLLNPRQVGSGKYVYMWYICSMYRGICIHICLWREREKE